MTLRCLFAAVVALLVAAPGEAAPFDAGTGKVSLEGAAAAWSLDAPDGAVGLRTELQIISSDGTYLPPSEEDVAGSFVGDTEPTIEGYGALRLGDGIDRLSLLFEDPSRWMGKRIEVRFWQRPEGVMLNGNLFWYGKATDGSQLSDFAMGFVRFVPTGRLADDGWFEVTSGPVDFALGGVYAAQMSVRPETDSMWGTVVPVSDGTALIDAFEVIDLGAAQVLAEPCDAAHEREQCGEYGTCLVGRCVDAAAVVGPAPAPALRDQFVDRRLFEVREFNGNHARDIGEPVFLAAMQRAREAVSARAYWTAIEDAYEALGDGHASPPSMRYASVGFSFGICANLGEADRLPGTPTRKLPLVGYATDAAKAAFGVEVGDAIVRIDSVPVEQWRTLAASHLRHHGSPKAREVATTPELIGAAAMTGGVIEFARCPADIAENGPCTEEQLANTTFTFDAYAAYGEKLWSQEPVEVNSNDWAYCDYRFQRSGTRADTPWGGSGYVGVDDTDGVRWLTFNGFPGLGGNWETAARTALTPGADVSAYLIDERTGNGGVIDAVQLFTAPFIDPAASMIAEIFPTTATLTDDAREAFRACRRTGYCGSHLLFGLAGGFNAGSLKDYPVAALISRDVSGNDYFTRWLKGRPNTIIFGDSPTFGAFGPIYSLAAYGPESSGGSAQMADSVFYLDVFPEEFEYESSKQGVEPDVTVFQKQSDLLRGVDTMVETARNWLMNGDAP